ncbi:MULTISPECIES: helix-turn-helix domain-containing protein [Micrococcales]|jgi:DNA-binding Xre family transcriptional regulator|nr:helix-turn-helix transcriptional regulator [Nesterenkonia ebinurensis]MBF9337601.1 helix-turn-helix transcriptional regulator [Microbacterium lacticum]MEA5119489.1 helix-turn-helix transcriptional regulator [Propionicimonas sp.]
MTRKLTMLWHLRQLMAAKGMFQTTDLMEPLHERGIELSRQMVHRIVTKPPQRINTDLLAALCDILDCTPSDLLELHVDQQRQAPAVGDHGPGIGDIRPIRARVRRPDGIDE